MQKSKKIQLKKKNLLKKTNLILNMDDDIDFSKIDLEDFVKPVIVIGIGIGSYFYKKSRIQKTELITDFAIKIKKNNIIF